MEQKSVHRFIYKIESKVLKRAKWNLTLPLKVAMRTCPEVIVSLNDSQCLRFIDEINGVEDINEKVRSIQRKIRAIKKLPKSPNNKMLINNYYDTLYGLQFQKDYVCVIMNNNKDYDQANLGFSINYGIINGEECIVRYRRFLGTNGGIKNSTIVYVNESIYPELKRRLDNGRDMTKELVPAKLEAYQSLICSGSIPLPPPKGFIVVKDCITRFKEDVILIDDSEDGEPKLTHEHDYEIEHNNNDGFGMMLPSYSKRVNEFLTGDGEHTIAGMNTRYAWTKGMIYTFDYIEFAENVAGSFYITDVWGDVRDVRDAEVILTESQLKLWDSYSSWEDYYENCEKNNYRFCVTKTTPNELENVRDTNYQFLQSYNLTDEELYELCKPTIDEIKDVMGLDYRKSLTFLAGFGMNDSNVFGENIDNCVKALMAEPKLINDPFIRRKIYNMIKRRIEMGMCGSIRINANFAMISGDIYALAQSIFGIEATGLLRKGEVYHKYWIDKGADEIACFRAPMTCHNNVRRMSLSKSEQAAYWFRYIDTVLIYNAWDTATESENGADFDGDTNFCTDNPVLLKNTLNPPTIICLQKKAAKIIPTEEDIIQANKLAFNDDIGTITNRVTSMFSVQSRFQPESDEYKELEYRIMCGQNYQQNAIDRAKGIIAKSMPKDWYDPIACKIKDDDDEETIRHKEFYSRIIADRKPYFMTYVYPRLRTENNNYISNNNSGAIRRFGQYGIMSVDDLARYEDKTPEMENYYHFYQKLLPVENSPCVVNRISRLFESEFKNYLSRISKLVREIPDLQFDYRIYKTDAAYSKGTYARVLDIYNEYNRRVQKYQQRKRTEKLDRFDNWIQHQALIDYFKSECFKVCPNGEELANIVLDICYTKESSKQFAWDVCGSIFVETILRNNDNVVQYPECIEDEGDFTYFGRNFKMKTKTIGVNQDDYNE